MRKVMVKLDHFTKKYGDKTIINDLSLNVYEGEFLTFLGASGCGKTTILRAISGIDQVTAGQVFIDGEEVTNLDPTKREVNTIFQNYALFPFMNVEKNIGFGLRMKKVKANIIKEKVGDMLKLIRLEGYEKRLPIELSGGEQQRVSIARGLINNPKVLLLDEPISALDQKLRKQMQIELKYLQKQLGITFIYVTHDQEEALTMSDRIILLNRGKVEQIDTPINIYRHPKSKYVADFIGESNLFSGTVMEINGDIVKIKLENDQVIEIVDQNCKPDESLYILIRPEEFRLVQQKKSGNQLAVTLKQIIYSGSFYKLIVVWNQMELKVIYKGEEEDLKVNETFYLEWDITDSIVIKERRTDEK